MADIAAAVSGAAHVVVAAVFAAAVTAKAADPGATVRWLGDLRFPYPSLVTALAIASEVLLVGALIAVPSVGLVLSAAWLVPATGVLLLARRRNVSGCGCFGTTEADGSHGVARNITLTLFSVGAVVVGGPGLSPELAAPLVLTGPAAILVQRTLAVRSLT